MNTKMKTYILRIVGQLIVRIKHTFNDQSWLKTTSHRGNWILRWLKWLTNASLVVDSNSISIATSRSLCRKSNPAVTHRISMREVFRAGNGMGSPKPKRNDVFCNQHFPGPNTSPERLSKKTEPWMSEIKYAVIYKIGLTVALLFVSTFRRLVFWTVLVSRLLPERFCKRDTFSF